MSCWHGDRNSSQMEEDIHSTLETLHDAVENGEKGRTSGVTEGKRVEEECSENYKGLCCISRRWVTLQVRTVWIFRSNRKSFVCSHWGVGSFSKGQKKEIGQFGKQGLVLCNAYQGHCRLTPPLDTCGREYGQDFYCKLVPLQWVSIATSCSINKR